MSKTPAISSRFELAMIPSLWMGIATNMYIACIFFWCDAAIAVLCPLLGTVIFGVAWYLLKKRKISASQTFFLTAYTVVSEIFFHTYFLGWDTGFYYYLFLLPAVFLLRTTWKVSVMTAFNGSIIVLTLLLYYFFKGGTPAFVITENAAEVLNLCNFAGTTLAALVVMIYFSRSLNIKDQALISANEELENRNRDVSRQHQMLQTLIKEVHHRVKNNLQIISSLMSLQHRTIEDEKLAGILAESKRRIEAIALIHQKLYQDDKVNSVDFRSYLEDLVSTQQRMNDTVTCTVDSDEATLHLDLAVPLGLIISELVTNAMKHAFHGIDKPSLAVNLKRAENHYTLTVSDNGVGLPDNFDLSTPTSLGMEIIEALTEQIHARVEHENDGGARFTLRFVDELGD